MSIADRALAIVEEVSRSRPGPAAGRICRNLLKRRSAIRSPAACAACRRASCPVSGRWRESVHHDSNVRHARRGGCRGTADPPGRPRSRPWSSSGVFAADLGPVGLAWPRSPSARPARNSGITIATSRGGSPRPVRVVGGEDVACPDPVRGRISRYRGDGEGEHARKAVTPFVCAIRWALLVGDPAREIQDLVDDRALRRSLERDKHLVGDRDQRSRMISAVNASIEGSSRHDHSAPCARARDCRTGPRSRWPGWTTVVAAGSSTMAGPSMRRRAASRSRRRIAVSWMPSSSKSTVRCPFRLARIPGGAKARDQVWPDGSPATWNVTNSTGASSVKRRPSGAVTETAEPSRPEFRRCLGKGYPHGVLLSPIPHVRGPLQHHLTRRDALAAEEGDGILFQLTEDVLDLRQGPLRRRDDRRRPRSCR